MDLKSKSALNIKNRIPEIVVGVLLFGILFAWSMVQPIETQPDELTRYMIPYYIFTNFKLPNGNLEELLVRGYGISYGFFPCLPYICMAPVMKLVSLFSDNSYTILMGARFVNISAGIVTYIYVRKLSKLLLEDEWLSWLFTGLICFWPQFLFMYTYTNCDAFALMSCAIISYAATYGIKKEWDKQAVINMIIGVSICLLSYFNAYGMILGAGIIFVLSFISKDGKFNSKAFFRVGGIILIAVFVLSGWWFIRNAFLYDGDFIGMRANRLCAEANAADYLKPSVRDTLKNRGESIFALLTDSSYIFLLKQSFFGRFGNMELAAPNYIIRFFKLLIFVGAAGVFVPSKNKIMSGIKRAAYDIGMLTAVITPVFLCFYYSYANDYQPQGRYMLPGLIPLICILILGYRNIYNMIIRISGKNEIYVNFAFKCIYICIYLYIFISTIGCLMLIWQTYASQMSETFNMIYTGNLYE